MGHGSRQAGMAGNWLRACTLPTDSSQRARDWGQAWAFEALKSTSSFTLPPGITPLNPTKTVHQLGNKNSNIWNLWRSFSFKLSHN